MRREDALEKLVGVEKAENEMKGVEIVTSQLSQSQET